MSNVGSEEADVPVVIVLGATGVGKSYFINKATGDDNVRVGPSPDPGKSDTM
jgi:putative ribosome biogenesis GTPase RsgA